MNALCLWYEEGEGLTLRGKEEYIAKEVTRNLGGCEWRLTESASAGQDEGSKMTSGPLSRDMCAQHTPQNLAAAAQPQPAGRHFPLKAARDAKTSL